MRLAQRRREWPRFDLPQQRGAVTVSQVLAEPAADRRDAMIRQWCVSVWDAWSDSHAQVRALLQEAMAQ
jgi:hypothetical protein